VYIELVRCGAKIIEFDKKRTWLNGKFHSDIFIQCDYGDDYYFFFWEICWTHKDIPLQYYKELCKSEEGLKIINYKGYIPKLIVMDDSSKEFTSDVLKIIKVDYNLSNLPLIFI
jgi:hypothetical protein